MLDQCGLDWEKTSFHWCLLIRISDTCHVQSCNNQSISPLLNSSPSIWEICSSVWVFFLTENSSKFSDSASKMWIFVYTELCVKQDIWGRRAKKHWSTCSLNKSSLNQKPLFEKYLRKPLFLEIWSRWKLEIKNILELKNLALMTQNVFLESRWSKTQKQGSSTGNTILSRSLNWREVKHLSVVTSSFEVRWWIQKPSLVKSHLLSN